MNKIILQDFINEYSPEITLKANMSEISKYKTILPLCLIELWTNYGFGLYGNRLIQVIYPDEYIDNLWGWLNQKNNYDRLPIAISSFGTIFYYRKLSETDHDIAFINPHNSQSGVLSWNIESFFKETLVVDEVKQEILDINLHKEAVIKNGYLLKDEMYCFTPALRLGGNKKHQNISKCNAKVHLDILLQLALGKQ